MRWKAAQHVVLVKGARVVGVLVIGAITVWLVSGGPRGGVVPPNASSLAAPDCDAPSLAVLSAALLREPGAADASARIDEAFRRFALPGPGAARLPVSMILLPGDARRAVSRCLETNGLVGPCWVAMPVDSGFAVLPRAAAGASPYAVVRMGPASLGTLVLLGRI